MNPEVRKGSVQRTRNSDIPFCPNAVSRYPDRFTDLQKSRERSEVQKDSLIYYRVIDINARTYM